MDMELSRTELAAIGGLILATVAFVMLYGRMMFQLEQRLNVVGLVVLVASMGAAILLI